MIEYGAEINLHYNSYPPLHWAIFSGKHTIVQLLLNHGADIEARNKNKHTALLYSIAINRPASLQLLIDFGANINAKDRFGFTASDLASKKLHCMAVLHRRNIYMRDVCLKWLEDIQKSDNDHKHLSTLMLKNQLIYPTDTRMPSLQTLSMQTIILKLPRGKTNREQAINHLPLPTIVKQALIDTQNSLFSLGAIDQW